MNLVKKLLIGDWLKKERPKWIMEGKALQEHRESLSLSLYRIAKNIGYSANTLRKLEAGKPLYSARKIRRVYRLYLETVELKNRIKMLNG